jgi:putative DNA primase/helicase
MAMEAGWKFKPGKVPKAKPPAPPPPPAPAPTQAPTPPNPVYELQNIWQRAAPATLEHPYCIAKGVNDPAMVAGLRVLPSTDSLRLKGHSMAGALLVPITSHDGALCTVQCIAQVGTKADGSPVFEKPNLKGYTFGDGFHVVGELVPGQPAYVVEGIGAAWAIYQATGKAAAITFGVGRTEKVARAIQQHHPEARIVLVPDVGQEAQAQKTAKELGCAVARMPEGLPSNYDAWDALNDEDLPGAVAPW